MTLAPFLTLIGGCLAVVVLMVLLSLRGDYQDEHQ